MKYFSLIILFLSLTLTSCEVIGGIFKAGMWVGIIGVCLVVGLILFVVNKIKR